MKKFDIMGYTVSCPKKMLIAINDEKNILVASDRAEKEIHCILDFSGGSILIESGWNIKYKIKDNNICLTYNYEDDE